MSVTSIVCSMQHPHNSQSILGVVELCISIGMKKNGRKEKKQSSQLNNLDQQEQP